MDIFDFVVVQVLLVDTVQAQDICIPLLLEIWPVERFRFLDRDAVSFGIVDSFSESGGVECNLLWYTSRKLLAGSNIAFGLLTPTPH